MSFRQKLNAAVHERAEARPRLSSRTDCSFRSEWATSCRVFRTTYDFPRGGGGGTCSSVDQEMVMPHHPTTRVLVSPLFLHILYLRASRFLETSDFSSISIFFDRSDFLISKNWRNYFETRFLIPWHDSNDSHPFPSTSFCQDIN